MTDVDMKKMRDAIALFLDPFGGIGNSLTACHRLGVSGIAIEVSKKYVKEAKRRLRRKLTLTTNGTAQIKRGQDVFDAEEHQ